MSWLFFSFIAPVFWALGNVGDKYVFSKWLKNSLAALFAFGLVGLMAACVVFLFKGFGHAPFAIILGCIGSGILYMFANLYYYRAVQLGEISRIIPVIYLEPLITAAISAIFLGEIFGPLKYLGVCLMVVGTIVISYEKSLGFRFSKAVWIALLAAVLFSINTVVTKFLVDRTSFWTVFAFVRIGTFLSLMVLAFFQKAAVGELARLRPLAMSAIGLNNMFTYAGILCFTIAASLGFITLTTSISAIQPFVVLLLAGAAHVFYPAALKEKNNLTIFFQKFIAIVIMFIGILLVTK